MKQKLVLCNTQLTTEQAYQKKTTQSSSMRNEIGAITKDLENTGNVTEII